MDEKDDTFFNSHHEMHIIVVVQCQFTGTFNVLFRSCHSLLMWTHLFHINRCENLILITDPCPIHYMYTIFKKKKNTAHLTKGGLFVFAARSKWKTIKEWQKGKEEPEREREREFFMRFSLLFDQFHFISFHSQCIIIIQLRNFYGKINENRKWNRTKCSSSNEVEPNDTTFICTQKPKSDSHSIHFGIHWLWHDFVIIIWSNRCFASMPTLKELK